MLLEHHVELLSLDDAEFGGQARVIGENRVDEVARCRTQVVPKPPVALRVVLEIPYRNTDLRLGARRRGEE